MSEREYDNPAATGDLEKVQQDDSAFEPSEKFDETNAQDSSPKQTTVRFLQRMNKGFWFER